MEKKRGVMFEYTNTCTCKIYDPDTDTESDAMDCYGDCWEYTVQDFTEITEHLFDINSTNLWKVSNLRLWNGDVSGFFKAQNAKELIQGMSVNSEWIMRGEVFKNHIEYSLSHHDAPMGSSSVVTIVSDEQREEYGLY